MLHDLISDFTKSSTTPVQAPGCLCRHNRSIAADHSTLPDPLSTESAVQIQLAVLVPTNAADNQKADTHDQQEPLRLAIIHALVQTKASENQTEKEMYQQTRWHQGWFAADGIDLFALVDNLILFVDLVSAFGRAGQAASHVDCADITDSLATTLADTD